MIKITNGLKTAFFEKNDVNSHYFRIIQHDNDIKQNSYTMSLTTLSNASATDEMRYEVLKKIGVPIKKFRQLTPAAKNDLLFKAMYDDIGINTPQVVNQPVFQRTMTNIHQVVNQPVFQRTMIVHESYTTMDVDDKMPNKKRKRN
jgi:hypothetical protein